MRSPVTTAAAAATLLLLLAGCTSGPTATATSIDEAVNIQPTSGEPRPVATEEPVSVGEIVKTDASGLSDIVFADGSYTRVGPSSELTIVELSTAQAQRSITSLDIGETWHRVKKLAAEDAAYEVETPVGTASVRGTAFAVACTSDTECTFSVLEGEVVVVLKDGTKVEIGAFERLSVPGTEPTPFPVDLIAADSWIMKNLELDDVALSDAADAAGVGDWEASTVGTWKAVYTVVSSDEPGTDVGDTAERDWTIAADACDTDSCTIKVSSSQGDPFTIDVSEAGLTWGDTGPAACYDVDPPYNLRTDYGFDQTVTTTLTPTVVSDVDGVPTVTEMSGTRTLKYDEKVPPDPACQAVQPHVTVTYSVTVTRTDS